MLRVFAGPGRDQYFVEGKSMTSSEHKYKQFLTLRPYRTETVLFSLFLFLSFPFFSFSSLPLPLSPSLFPPLSLSLSFPSLPPSLLPSLYPSPSPLFIYHRLIPLGLIVAAWTVGCALAGISMLASTKVTSSLFGAFVESKQKFVFRSLTLLKSKQNSTFEDYLEASLTNIE